MGRRMGIFDIPPLPRPEESESMDGSDLDQSAPCEHEDTVLIEKIEHRFRQDAMQTVYTHCCVKCGERFSV